MMHANTHTPVMVTEILEGLNIKPEGIYIDATFGRGGHTKQILARLASTGKIMVIDKDPEAIAIAKQLSFLRDIFPPNILQAAHLLPVCGS